MTTYLDNAASTKIDDRVLDAMLPYLKENFGNPSSAHKQGKLLKVLIEDARETIADFFGTKPKEIFFTSGGTESNNFAIKGCAFSSGGKFHSITSSIEHPAVLETFNYLCKFGFEADVIKPDSSGTISPALIESRINSNTKLISVMHANNEIGNVNDVKTVSSICRSRGILFHSDTVQSVGKMEVKPKELGMDFLTLSAHKIYGPKGIGILFIDEKVKIDKYVHGGSQERNMRGGTENVASVAGMKRAVEILRDSMDDDIKHYSSLKNILLKELFNSFSGMYVINGDQENSLPNILNVSFLPDKLKLSSGMLPVMLDLKDVAVSGGSACSSGSLKPSGILLEMGIEESVASSTIRVSFGRFNTDKDVYTLIKSLKEIFGIA
ncbi:MAG: cysteine desulfurase family protein [Ignavibacteria bacterium]